MADSATIASYATAAGTLVLAVATFSAVRSSNRFSPHRRRVTPHQHAPTAHPVAVSTTPSKGCCGIHHHAAHINGRTPSSRKTAGSSIWRSDCETLVQVLPCSTGGTRCPIRRSKTCPTPQAEDFRRLTIDLYIPAGGSGYWEAAVREPDDPLRPGFMRALTERHPFMIDILYGDQQGRQRTISRYLSCPQLITVGTPRGVATGI